MWYQYKSHAPNLRRTVKERPKPNLSTSRKTRASYYGLHIDDICDAALADVECAIARFGQFFLQQRKGTPQGSPTSVFLANTVGSYLEERGNTRLTREPTFTTLLKKIIFHRIRWVDDIFILFALPHHLHPTDVTALLHFLIHDFYQDFLHFSKIRI